MNFFFNNVTYLLYYEVKIMFFFTEITYPMLQSDHNKRHLCFYSTNELFWFCNLDNVFLTVIPYPRPQCHLLYFNFSLLTFFNQKNVFQLHKTVFLSLNKNEFF